MEISKSSVVENKITYPTFSTWVAMSVSTIISMNLIQKKNKKAQVEN